MSTKQNPSLCTLPVELIFHIFRHLDAQTIVRSFRRVCKRLFTITNTYDRFNFDFKSILKSDFHFLCNYVQPKQVISLTLSDDDETPGQIVYFLSLFRLNQFIQLRCLTLFEIDDCHLSIILKDIKTLELNSLIIHSNRDYSQSNTTTDDFSSIFSINKLHKVIINIPNFGASQIVWPVECRLEHLEINCRTLSDYCSILRYLPNLRVLVLEYLDEQMTDGTLHKLANLKPFRQLFSLTFKYSRVDMIILELLLLLAPSVQHLRLMRSVDVHMFTSHAPRWEKFVREKLPLLNKFEFFLTEDPQLYNPSVDTELLITPFRTSFWTETKKWSVICDYITNQYIIILYSSSFFDPQFEYVYQPKQTRRSTSIPTDNNIIIMHGVHKMRLYLPQVMSLTTSPQGGLPNSFMFPKLDELTLCMDDQWPTCSLRFLSTLIDLSHLVKLSLQIGNSLNSYAESRANIDTLLKLTRNIRSFTILVSTFQGYVDDHNIDIYFIVPNNVRHLRLSVTTVDQMRMVLRQLKYRPSIRFEYKNNYFNFDGSEMHVQWLNQETGYYTYRLNRSSICMWFDNYVNSPKVKKFTQIYKLN